MEHCDLIRAAGRRTQVLPAIHPTCWTERRSHAMRQHLVEVKHVRCDSCEQPAPSYCVRCQQCPECCVCTREDIAWYLDHTQPLAL